MQQVKNIIFDLGGVIMDIDYSRTQHAFETLGVTQFNELFTQYHSSEIFAKLETGKITDEDFYNEFRKEAKINLTDNQITTAWNAMLLGFPAEKINFLKEIKSKYNTFLFSNTNQIHHAAFHKMFYEKYGHFDFGNLFRKAYYSHKIGLRKPLPESFIFILNEQKIKPEETLFIDDTLINIEAAKKLGLQTIYLVAPKNLLNINL